MIEIKRRTSIFLLLISVCISLSGLLSAVTSSSTYAKSIPEEVADWFSGKKDSQDAKNTASTKKAMPTSSVKPVQSATTQSTTQTSATATTSAITPTQPTSKSGDTSTQVRQVAVAQAVRTNVPSVYTTAKIPDTERNDLYKVSLIIISVGSILYLLSYVKSWHFMYRNAIAPSKILTE
ncbi:MAG: hypothetical protein JWN75_349 [Candidatus Saccharibacteria bacterium]|nr:hypothetical protein [Candidatus Saccharibacteria bacterium]